MVTVDAHTLTTEGRAADPSALRPIVTLAEDERGRPRVGLTLVLDRKPAIDERDLVPLIARGVFAMTLTLEFSSALEQDGPAAGDAAGRPFVRAGKLRLRNEESGTCLVQAEVTGSHRTVALGATVAADVAVALLAALDGGPSGLVVEHELELRGEPVTTLVQLRGMWAGVWDLLASAAGERGVVTSEQVLASCREAITGGVVQVRMAGGGGGAPSVVDAAADLLRSGVGFLLGPGPEGTFVLQRRPSPYMPLSLAEELTFPDSLTISGATPVDDLLKKVDRDDHDRIIRLVALAPGAVGTPMPVVMVDGVARSRARPARGDTELVSIDERLTAVPLVLADSSQLGAESSAAAYETLVLKPASKSAAVVGPMLYLDPSDEPRPGPIVTEGDAAVFVDRADPGRRWYVPDFRLRLPAADVDPAASPFSFTFARLGVASGSVPTVGLDATIQLTLDPFIPEAVKQALSALGNPPAQPVPLVGPSASLEVPYRVEGSGDTLFHALTGQLVPIENGSFRLTVRALDHVARLCYGALAYEGFQSQPPAVVVHFSFEGWTRSGARSMRAVSAFAEVGTRRRSKRLSLDRDKFQDDVLVDLPTGPKIKTKPGTPWWELKTDPPVRWVDPDLDPIGVVPKAAWSSSVVGRALRVPALVRCADHPTLYRQSEGATTRAIGCQDALRLGESAPPGYADIPDAAASTHRVLRSLQQPDRFVVLPAAFKITRGAPDAGARAYRPSILIHAALGGSGPDRYVFTATLAPAIPLHSWAKLVRLLRAKCPPGVEPYVQLPTDPTVQAEVSYRWTLPADVAEPMVTRRWEGFQVAVSTQLAAGLLLNSLIETSGLSGEVQFTLPGGLPLTSALVLDTDVVGPWLFSPLTVETKATADGEAAVVTNRTERTADVFDLLTPGGTVAVTVEAALEPGQSLSVPLSGPGDGLIAVYTLHAAALRIEQLSVYIADVSTRLSVVNLVNYANNGLTRLDLELRTGAGAVSQQPIDEGGQAEITLTFPLTSYLSARSVDIRVRELFRDGRQAATAWSTWDLASKGNVISLTSQFLGLGAPS
jgi:hypothetical protein